MIAFGCEDKNKTPLAEDRVCPKCGEELEVFLIDGKVMEDVVCDCGYIIKAEVEKN